MMKPKNTQWKYMFDINEYLWTIPYFINYLFKNSQFSLSIFFTANLKGPFGDNNQQNSISKGSFGVK